MKKYGKRAAVAALALLLALGAGAQAAPKAQGKLFAPLVRAAGPGDLAVPATGDTIMLWVFAVVVAVAVVLIVLLLRKKRKSEQDDKRDS